MQASPAVPAEPGAIAIVAGLPRDVALGRAVVQVMTRPAFARLPFGSVVRALAGQVGRGHYAFAARDGRVLGFAGWGMAARPAAEDWVSDDGLGDAGGRIGDCLLLAVWQAETAAVSRALIAHIRTVLPEVRRLYARRLYPDGRVRPVRLALRPRP